MSTDSHFSGVWRVVAGASLWGTIGLFVTELGRAGLTTLDIAASRVVIMWLGLALIALAVRGLSLRLRRRDLPFFFVYGLVSVTLYSLLYFEAIELEGLAVAVALLNTAPLWTVLIARLVLRERITPPMAAAVGVGVAGTLLTVGVGAPAVGASLAGVGAGLACAVCWGLFSIFGKRLQARYDPFTTLFYTFGVGGLTLTAAALTDGMVFRIAALEVTGWVLMLGLGLIPTLLGYWLFVSGLHRVTASEAAILTLSETFSAVALGVLWFGEHLTPTQILGIIMVVAAGASVALRRRPTFTAKGGGPDGHR